MAKRVWYWTTEELNIIKEHGSSMLIKELMELLPNRTADSIHYKRGSLGITIDDNTRQRMLNTRRGKVTPVYGVGINDLCDDPNYNTIKYDHSSGKKKVIWKCPFYEKWTGMLYRCYGSDAPAYKGCTVSEEWHYFSNFKKWMESRSWEGKQIDKDILVPGNKVYGEKFCLLVTRDLNNIIISNEYERGELPKGVSPVINRDKTTTRYHARQSKYGKDCHIGYFDTVEEAALAYREHRQAYLLEVANGLTLNDTSDVEATRVALLRHMESELIV